MDIIREMEKALTAWGSGPTFQEMPRNSLCDKGIAGPTAAHRIEEIHTPLNISYITCTTGTTAFQNIVGVTQQELPARIDAGMLALKLCGLKKGDKVVITYPPLVNVFSKYALDKFGIEIHFIQRPSRDALLVSLCTLLPRAVIGESSFLRAALEDARKLHIWNRIPENLIFIAAGTPLDSSLAEMICDLPGAKLHDLYGCQEFGWLALDGHPLRKDLTLFREDNNSGRQHLLVGGIATGDCFPVGHHPLSDAGVIVTPHRIRTDYEPETTLLATTVSSPGTALRAARTLLRIKGRILRVSPEPECRANATVLRISLPGTEQNLILQGPEKTQFIDDLITAQCSYQREAKTDPVWNKPC